MINLVRLLPATIRDLFRYKDIVSVYQQYIYEDVKPQIDTFETRFLYENITDEDLIKTLFDYGYVLSQGQGYTATSRYIRKHFRTMLNRLKIKGTEKSYQYLFYVYELIGDIYPLIYRVDGSLEPYLNWLVSDETDPPPILLDSGRTLDEDPYEGYPYWTLDYGGFVNSTTRHMLISYVPRYIENETEFMSADTALAFYKDVAQNKRKVEIPHYEFRLYADAPATQLENIEVWENFENTLTANQRSVVCGTGNLNNAYYVQFGDGAHSPVNNTITGVNSLIQQYPLSDFLIKLKSSSQLYFKHKIYATTKFFDYKEIAILDNSSNCLFYSTFPWVRYDANMLSHGYFFINKT